MTYTGTRILQQSMPLVSAAIVSYRQSRDVEKALASLLNQTYKNTEILVLYDGAADPEIDELVKEYAEIDNRIHAFKDANGTSLQTSRRLAVAESTGEFFLWVSEEDSLPENYIEACMKKVVNAPQVQLVGARADVFWEGRYLQALKNYSDCGESLYQRLGNLIAIGYLESNAFQQYFFGIFRRETLMDCLWEEGSYYYREKFSVFFRVSSRGFIDFSEEVTLEQYSSSQSSRGQRKELRIDRPRRYRIIGQRAEKIIPMTLNILATVANNQALSLIDKMRLWIFCLTRFFHAWLGNGAI